MINDIMYWNYMKGWRLNLNSFLSKLSSDYFIIGLTIMVFILDAGNGLIPIIPLREIAFLLAFAKLVYYYLKGFRDKRFITFLLICIIVPLYGSIISLINGTPIGYIIGDANGYVFLITGLSLAFITYANPNIKGFIKKMVIFCSLILSCLTILIFLLHLIGVNIYIMGNLLSKYNLGFAGIEINGEIRIFFRGFIYVMLSFFILLGSLLTKEYNFNKKKDIFILLIFSLALILSNTRGIWVSTFIGSFIIFLSFNGLSLLRGYLTKLINSFLKRKVISVLILLIGITGVYFIFGSYISNTFERVTSIVDFTKNNESNNIRKEQSNELLQEFSNQPIFGKGFGSTLDSGYIRSAEEPYSFELSYFELLYKLGIVGFSLFIIGIVIFGLTLFQIKEKNTRVIFFAAFISLLFISVTNPYIVSSLGILYLSITYAFTNSIYSIKK